jgi:tetratricopeptide (TPR) repeat protein
MAAIVATSGIGLLRTHGRAARSRASAASTVAPAPPVAPTPPAPPAANPEWPVAPALAESPPRAMAANPAAVAARVPIRALDRTPRNAPADRLLREANNLWERGNTPGAYALARQAVAAGAGAPAHVLLGALLINMKNYAAAEPELATATRLDPHNAEARRMLALLDRTAAEHQAQ